MHSRLPRGVRPRLEGKPRTPLSSRVATRVSWSPLCGLKGVQPPLPFGERTRDCSPGHAGKEGPQLARTGASQGFPRSVGAEYATGDQWRNNSRKNEGMEPKQNQHPVVNGTGDGSRVRCCKEQYCIGTWNVRSMNQGKVEVVKQEMARVNINILEIELKWTAMGEFNSDDHYTYYCGQESPRRNGVDIIRNKRV